MAQFQGFHTKLNKSEYIGNSLFKYYICSVRITSIIVFLFLSVLLSAQNQDSLQLKTNPGDVVKTKPEISVHSPKKAAILSTILPGAGQVYNHQVWKVPVIYGGLGALGYFVYDNNRVYNDYLTQWKYLTDSNSNTNVRPSLQGVSADALHNAFSSFRKYRDQCIIGVVLLYAANIIDANVYAHLYKFNVDDLSVHFTPNYNIYSQKIYPGLSMRYKF